MPKITTARKSVAAGPTSRATKTAVPKKPKAAKPPPRKKPKPKKPSSAKKPKAAKKRRRPKKLDLRNPNVRAKLKKRNLERLMTSMPGLFSAIQDYRPMSKLVVLDDGQTDVLFEGEYFYNKSHDAFVADQLEAYWKQPNRLVLGTLQPQQVDEVAAPFLHNVIKRSDEAGLQFHVGHSADESYYLFVFGFGLGSHLIELVERTNCKALAVIESNMEFLVHSLEVFDWCRLLDIIDERQGLLNVFVNNSPLVLGHQIRYWLRGVNPMSVDGSTIFTHYHNPILNSALKKLREDRHLILKGLGFFTDEILMLKNTHHNLYSGKERVFIRPEKPRIDAPVFVVANGPSLDDDLDFIRENQDRAIIITSGSSFRPLVLSGILPDFQMETENIEVRPLIAQVAKNHDISSVCLVTSTTVDVEAPPFFDRVLYYFRGALSSYPIFCNSERRILLNPNPTVLNASLSFVQEMGFRKFYFFGTDMGTTMGPERHHSKKSYQYTKGSIYRPQVFNIPVAANFGGTCMTSEDLYWTRDAVERAIRDFSLGYSYFNCSNGVKIEGTVPMSTDLIELDDLPGGKQPIVDRIVGNFPVYDREEFDNHWNDDKIQEMLGGWLDELEALTIKQKNYDDLSYLTRLMRHLNPVGASGRDLWGPALVFRGTIFQVMIATEYYLRRLVMNERRKFEKIARQELQALIEELREAAAEELGTLSKDAAEKLKLTKKKSTRKRGKPARAPARA